MANISDLNATYNPVDIDARPGNYYVSVVDHDRVGLLLGPFAKHAESLANVSRCQKHAREVNDNALWYAYGTMRFEDYSKPGLFNDMIGLSVPAEQ